MNTDTQPAESQQSGFQVRLSNFEGPVDLSDDLEQVQHWATILGGRYMGEETAEDFGNRNAVPGELLARLRPEKVISAKDLAD